MDEKKKVGRPSTYKPEYCEQLIEHMSQGLSFESFAGRINTTKQTLYTWTQQYPDFLDAKKRGEEKSREVWEKMGMKGMWSGKKFNPTVWIFNMKNRFGWRDQQNEMEVSQRGTFKFNLNPVEEESKTEQSSEGQSNDNASGSNDS